MVFGLLDRRPVLDYITLGSDHYRGANRALDLLTVHHFLAEGAVFFHHRGRGIRQQRKRELVLAGKPVMRFDAVFAHSEHHRAGLLEGGVSVAKAAGLLGTTWRVVLWIKIEHHGFGLVLVERVLLAVVALQAQGRRLLAF